MSTRAAGRRNLAAVSGAGSDAAARAGLVTPAMIHPLVQAGPSARVAVFEASRFAGLTSTACVFADSSFVDV